MACAHNSLVLAAHKSEDSDAREDRSGDWRVLWSSPRRWAAVRKLGFQSEDEDAQHSDQLSLCRQRRANTPIRVLSNYYPGTLVRSSPTAQVSHHIRISVFAALKT